MLRLLKINVTIQPYQKVWKIKKLSCSLFPLIFCIEKKSGVCIVEKIVKIYKK